MKNPEEAIKGTLHEITFSFFARSYSPISRTLLVVVSSSTSASSPSLLETSPSSSPKPSDVQLIRIGLRGSRSNYSIILPNINAPNKEEERSSFDVIEGKEIC